MAVARPEDVPPPRPNGQGPDGDLSPADWGRHLRSDYRHDGLDPTIPYNIGRDTNAARQEELKIVAGARVARYYEMSEEEFMDYATNLNYMTAQNVFKARMAGRLKWRIATETEDFDGTAPRLFEAGNQFISVITDAGKYLSTYLGAQNTISFGTCIDPAMSAITPDKKPVFYDVPVARQPIFIDLIQFGFDPRIIRGIWIVRVLGAAIVKSLWIMGDGTRIDPVTRKRYPRILIANAHDARVALAGINPLELGGKVINQTAPDKAGYYTSNAGAKEIGVRAEEQDLYKLGKTLGDTMIVASAMKTFKIYDPTGTTILEERPNPYYGVGPPDYPADLWKNHFNTSNRYPYDVIPQTVLMKTGDLLNTVRALFKGVPAIMERQARGTVPKYYEFYPGIPAPDQIVGAIIPGYTRIIADCDERFGNFINNIEATAAARLPTAGGDLRVPVAGEGARGNTIKLTAAQLGKARAFINDIIAGVNNLRLASLNYLNRKKAEAEIDIDRLRGNMTIEAIEPIQQTYNRHVQEMVLISPQTAKIEENEKLKPIIVVSRPGGGRLDIGGQVIVNTEIHLLGALSAIAAENDPVLNGIKQQFLEKIPRVDRLPAAPPTAVLPAASAIPAAVGDIADGGTIFGFIRDTLRRWIAGLFTQFAPAAGGQRGGNRPGFVVDWGPVSGYAIPSDIASMTIGLLEYMAAFDIGTDVLDRLTLIYTTLTMYDTDDAGTVIATVENYADRRIVDTIRQEFIQLKYMGVLSFPTKPVMRLVYDPDRPGPRTIPNTAGGAAGPEVLNPETHIPVFSHETIPYASPMLPTCYLFKAFAAYINVNNAQIIGGDDELVDHFQFIEASLRSFIVAILSAPPPGVAVAMQTWRAETLGRAKTAVERAEADRVATEAEIEANRARISAAADVIRKKAALRARARASVAEPAVAGLKRKFEPEEARRRPAPFLRPSAGEPVGSLGWMRAGATPRRHRKNRTYRRKRT